jgi:hypothetical protein
MLIIQREASKLGYTLTASSEISQRFLSLAAKHNVTLEEAVRRALVPSICDAMRAPERDLEHIETLLEKKMDQYPDHK